MMMTIDSRSTGKQQDSDHVTETFNNWAQAQPFFLFIVDSASAGIGIHTADLLVMYDTGVSVAQRAFLVFQPSAHLVFGSLTAYLYCVCSTYKYDHW